MSAAPAPQGEGGDDDDEGIMLGVLADVAPPSVAVAADRRRRRARPAGREGTFWSWLISDRDASPPACADELPPFVEPLAAKSVLGLVCVAWRFAEPDDTSRAEHAMLQPTPSRRASRAQPPWGFIQYRFLESVTLAAPAEVPDDIDVADAFASRRLRDLCLERPLNHGNTSCGDYLATHLQQAAVSVVTLESCVASAAVAAGSSMVAHSIALPVRGVQAALAFAHPQRRLVDRWRAELDVARARGFTPMQADAADDAWKRIALELPVERAKAVNAEQNAPAGSKPAKMYPRDPLHVIKSLCFSKLIRDQKN